MVVILEKLRYFFLMKFVEEPEVVAHCAKDACPGPAGVNSDLGQIIDRIE